MYVNCIGTQFSVVNIVCIKYMFTTCYLHGRSKLLYRFVMQLTLQYSIYTIQDTVFASPKRRLSNSVQD